jgi:site-specific DNA recombinase
MNEQNEIIKSKLAVIYCRVSTEEQAKQGMSIKSQETICREAADKERFTVIDVIRDEGKSGGSMLRPGIKRLQRLAEEKAINAVFVIHGDRLARNTEGHIALMNLFDANKIEVKAIHQPTFDRSTATGLLSDTMLAAFAEHFRKNISEKTLSSMEVKAKEGWSPSTPPIGYITIKNNRHEGEASKHIIIPDPRTASLMQEGFQLYSTGNYNVTELQEILYEKGLSH